MNLIKGDRIEMIFMKNDPNPVESGTTGTVTHVSKTPWDGETQVHVDWDNGRRLMVILPHDRVQKIN